jgi:putative isomerase
MSMQRVFVVFILAAVCSGAVNAKPAAAQPTGPAAPSPKLKLNGELARYAAILRKGMHKSYRDAYGEPGNNFKNPFFLPGSSQYDAQLWDWDSWIYDIAVRQITLDAGTAKDKHDAMAHGRGSVLNFLGFGGADGWLPITIFKKPKTREQMLPKNPFTQNMHKPVLAQHAAFLVQMDGDAEWLREGFYFIQAFLNNYRNHHRNKATGLFYWQTDLAVGIDNDPAVFYRPPGSSGSIYLNSLMYRELLAAAFIADKLNQSEIGKLLRNEAEDLRKAIQQHMWDERDGFFYSVDLNLLPVTTPQVSWELHSGGPRDYDCLIQRLGVWTGFMPLWAEIATPEQAKRIVNEHLKNEKTFGAPFGVRSLSKMEKMYNVRASGNPSSWLGPVWSLSNYIVFRGLVKYGYAEEARELAEKTIRLIGRDFERFGAGHEYYLPESGEPVLNKGFMDWNYLVINMLAWLEGKPVVAEF